MCWMEEEELPSRHFASCSPSNCSNKTQFQKKINNSMKRLARMPGWKAISASATSQRLLIAAISPSSSSSSSSRSRAISRHARQQSSSNRRSTYATALSVASIHPVSFPKRFQSSSSSRKSNSDHQQDPQQDRDTSSSSRKASWGARMRESWRKTPVRWTPLPIAGGIALLVAINLWKQSGLSSAIHSPDFRDGTYDSAKDNAATVQGPWQVCREPVT